MSNNAYFMDTSNNPNVYIDTSLCSQIYIRQKGQDGHTVNS